MYGFQVKIVADSISPDNVRLTTIQLRYPRWIHAEFLTHRVFSRNASSSRAIPVKKMIAQVRQEPATPINWGANRPGMQAKEQLKGWRLVMAKHLWKFAAKRAANVAWLMERLGLHKQVANRILEPFQFISVIVTATEWDNFWALRCHPDAQPEIQYLAELMLNAYVASMPVERFYSTNHNDANNWHLPYISELERSSYRDYPEFLAKLSTARCARVSYLTHDGALPDCDKDLKLHNDLVGAEPIHASPTEHQAYPIPAGQQSKSNFRGWWQYRKTVEANLEK